MSTNGQRRPRNRALRTFAIVATAAIALAGCAAGGNDGGGDDGGITEIGYGIWDAEQASAMEEIIDRFEDENPDIKVNLQVTPWEQYWTKLQTAATGGSAPDVFWMTIAFFPNYANGGAIASLQDLIDSGDIDVDMANYNETIASAYNWEGEVYGIPKDIDSIALWYNKTMFEEAGIPVPDDTWTWEKAHEVAAQLTNEEAGVWGIAAQISDQQSYYTTIPQAGGYVVNDEVTESGYDLPESIAGLEYWVDFIEEGSSPTIQQMTDTDPLSMFTSGKVAMLYDGSWTAIVMAQTPYTQENVDVSVLPDGAQPGGVVNGLANVMFSGSEHPEESAKFLEYLGSEEAARIQAEGGVVIPAYEGMADVWAESYADQFNVEAFFPGLEVGSPFPASLNTAEWRDFANEEFVKAWALQEPVDVVAKRVADHMDEVLADEGD